MELLLEYGLFLLKVATVAVAVIAVIVVAASASRGESKAGSLKVENLNAKYRNMANTLRKEVFSKHEWKEAEKQQKKALKAAEKSDDSRRKVFVLHFRGDIRATGVESLREEVSAVVAVATPEDEVVICLENAGGAVQDHGLGASQLLRVKDKGIPLTVIVDKVAASGGYLMAAIADRFIAAPFAIIGSIGVLAQLPNFHRFLENRGIEFEQITAGKYKRTLTMFGENTEEHREKTREELEEVHALFKTAVTAHRPDLDIDTVATGEHWYGSRALELGLIDELGSSDDYLMTAADDADIYDVRWKGHEGFVQKLQGAVSSLLATVGLEPRPPLG